MAPRDDRVEHGAGIPPGGAPEEFRTARLRAWRISRRDLAPMAAMNADPRVMQALGGVGDEEESRAWIAEKEAHWREHGFGVYVLGEVSAAATPGDGVAGAGLGRGGAIVGRAGLQYTEVDGETALELLYALRRDSWDMGYATEAARGVLDIAFGVMRLPRVVAVVLPANVRSRHVVEKLGFTFERMAVHEDELHRLYQMSAGAWAAWP